MGHIILSFLFYNIILCIFYYHYKRGDYFIKKTNIIIYTILFIFYGAYGGGEGDYLGYKFNVEQINSILDVYYYNSMEVQYNYLAYLLNGNYFLWRLVIFSIQFVGLSWFLYKAKLNTYPIFFSFVAICLFTSIYGRRFWGFIYFFMGVYLMIEKKNPLFLIIIVLAYISHTQNIVLLALLPFIFIDIKKWHLLGLLLFFGVFVSFYRDIFNNFINIKGIEYADYIYSKLYIYSQGAMNNILGHSIGENIVYLLVYTPLITVIIYMIILIFKSRKKYLSIYTPYRRIINVSIVLFFLSLIVLAGETGNATIFRRILGMILFPFSLIIPYLAHIKFIGKRTLKLILLISILAVEVNYIKDLYYYYVSFA